VRIVLQDINGVKNLDAYTKNFADSTFLIGKAGKEPANG
jgi:ATP phosphoribosyltransferase regulatory subunit